MFSIVNTPLHSAQLCGIVEVKFYNYVETASLFGRDSEAHPRPM